VHTRHRRHGIARALLQHMLGRRPHAELACATSKVPTFEALGFQLLAARGPHVLLSNRDYRSSGMVAVQDLNPIYQSKEVRQIHAYLLKQHGEDAMGDAERQRDHLLDEMTFEAQALLKERFPTIH
jgi:predicted RNA binding protein YcfA (HicA-like mRNA interferase family)